MSTAIFCAIISHNSQRLNIHSSSRNEGANFREANKNFNTQAEFYIPTGKQPFAVDRLATWFEIIVVTQLTKQNAQVKLMTHHVTY